MGKKSFYIDPYGNVYPCAFSEGNLLIGNLLKDGYNNITNKLNSFMHSEPQCIKCPIHRYDNNAFL